MSGRVIGPACGSSKGNLHGQPGADRATRRGQLGNRISIEYRLPASGEVEIRIFDLAGRRVATLERSIRDRGIHHVEWNAERVSRGVYFFRLTSGSSRLTQTLIVR